MAAGVGQERVEHGSLETGLCVETHGPYPGNASRRSGHNDVGSDAAKSVPQEHFRVAPQASGETGHDQIFQVAPGIEDRSNLLQFKSGSWASLDAGRVAVAEIALHHLIGQDIIGDPAVRACESAELAVYAFFFVPFHNPGVQVLGQGSRGAVHHALRLAALTTQGNPKSLLFCILCHLDA